MILYAFVLTCIRDEFSCASDHTLRDLWITYLAEVLRRKERIVVRIVSHELVWRHGNSTLVDERKGEHLLSKGVIRSQTQGLMVTLNRFAHLTLKISFQLMSESQCSVRARRSWCKTQSLLIPGNCFLKTVLLAICMCQIHCSCLPSSRRRQWQQ